MKGNRDIYAHNIHPFGGTGSALLSPRNPDMVEVEKYPLDVFLYPGKINFPVGNKVPCYDGLNPVTTTRKFASGEQVFHPQNGPNLEANVSSAIGIDLSCENYTFNPINLLADNFHFFQLLWRFRFAKADGTIVATLNVDFRVELSIINPNNTLFNCKAEAKRTWEMPSGIQPPEETLGFIVYEINVRPIAPNPDVLTVVVNRDSTQGYTGLSFYNSIPTTLLKIPDGATVTTTCELVAKSPFVLDQTGAIRNFQTVLAPHFQLYIARRIGVTTDSQYNQGRFYAIPQGVDLTWTYQPDSIREKRLGIPEAERRWEEKALGPQTFVEEYSNNWILDNFKENVGLGDETDKNNGYAAFATFTDKWGTQGTGIVFAMRSHYRNAHVVHIDNQTYWMENTYGAATLRISVGDDFRTSRVLSILQGIINFTTPRLLGFWMGSNRSNGALYIGAAVDEKWLQPGYDTEFENGTYSTYLWRSADLGRTWTMLANSVWPEGYRPHSVCFLANQMFCAVADKDDSLWFRLSRDEGKTWDSVVEIGPFPLDGWFATISQNPSTLSLRISDGQTYNYKSVSLGTEDSWQEHEEGGDQ